MNPWDLPETKEIPTIVDLTRVAEILRAAPDQRDKEALQKQADTLYQTITDVQEQDIDYREVVKFLIFQGECLGIGDWVRANIE